MQLSQSLDQTELAFLKDTVLQGKKRRNSTLSTIQRSIDEVQEILERDASYTKEMRIKNLESNLIENKISFFLAQSVQDLNKALIEFLDLQSERNILIELEEELLINDVYSLLKQLQLSPMICHPSFSDTKAFNMKTGIRKLNTLPSGGVDLRRFYEKIKEKSLYSSTGISSADFLAFDTGTIIIRDLQRWRGILTTAPEKHLAIVNVDRSMKYYSILSFMNQMKHINPQYLDTNLILSSSPSRTGDIERILVYGAHGPLSVGVIAINTEVPTLNGNSCNFYSLSLVLEATFPELKHIANFFYFPSTNPVTLLTSLEKSNAINIWALAHTILQRTEHSDLTFPDQIIQAYDVVKTSATRVGNLEDQETDRLKDEVHSLLTTLEVNRKD